MKNRFWSGNKNAGQGETLRRSKVGFLFPLLFIATVFTVSSHAQDTYPATNEESRTVREVFGEIESTSEYIFFYLDNSLDLDRRVSVKVDGESVEKVLDQIFSGTNNRYHISNRQIIVSQNPTPAPAASTQVQTRTISGVVRDSSGPVVGAYVSVKGTSRGTITDSAGEFSIPNVAPNTVLSISLIGYATQEVTITGQSVVNVVLAEDVQVLDELVVIGYGVVRKSDLTGSVASVKGEDLTRMATSDPVLALQGRAAGVSVILGSGGPDAEAAIKIRGVGTFNDSNPLYVVDGFPMSGIGHLNPNDIQSVEVLKDASATAIYGSRGANGVVLVTTKQGEKGALKVNLTAIYGIEGLPKKVNMLSAPQYTQLTNEAYINDEMGPVFSNTSVPSTNWWDEVSRTGRYQNYNISLSGGGERLTTMMSANYYSRDGIIRSTESDRLTFTQNSSFEATSWLKLTSNFSGSYTTYHGLDNNSVFLTSLIAPPDVPVHDENNLGGFAGFSRFRLENPVGRIARNFGTNRRHNISGNFKALVDILPGLTFSSQFGISHAGTYNDGFTPEFYETMDNSVLINNVTRNTMRAIHWNWTNILTYHKNWNNVHDLSVMASMEAYEYNQDSFRAEKRGIPVESPEFWYFNSATELPHLTEGSGESLAMLSYFTRINYNLLNRYLFTVTMRADGSSRFIGDNRWGYFPSGSLAWRLSEEPFFKDWNPTWWDDAKVRVGYGENGNERVRSYYPYLTPIAQRNYYTIGANQTLVNGSIPSGIGNPAVKWETVKQFNVGLDLSFLRGRLDVTADYYIRKTDDILLNQSIPRVAGFGSMTRNVGGMQNKGFELTLNWRETVGDFSYGVSANADFIRNKVTNLGTSTSLAEQFTYDYALIELRDFFGNMIRSEVGKTYRQFYGYVTDGIFQSQAEIDSYVDRDGKKIQADALPGDMRFRDLDGNGSIGTGDMTFIGNALPTVNYGISFEASYKGFDINMLLQGSAGGDIYNASKFYLMRFDGRQNVRTDYLDAYWSPSNRDGTQPVLSANSARNSRNYRNSDWYVEDGSYLRLKNLQVGYTFNPNLGRGVRPSIRVYVTAQNLLTLTGYSGFEPEIGGNDYSVDRGLYPQARLFTFGTSINF